MLAAVIIGGSTNISEENESSHQEQMQEALQYTEYKEVILNP